MTGRPPAEQEVIILGAGGTGRDVLDWLEAFTADGPPYRCIGFLDDDERKWGRELRGVPVLGPLRSAPAYPRSRFVNALGSPANFSRRPNMVSGISDDRFLTLIHPRAHVSRSAQIGRGSLVYPHVAVASGVRIGSHVTVLANAVINHDAVIGNYSIVATSASLSGGVSVGSCCYIGAGSQVIQGAVVGEGSLVGMGSVVIRDVPPHTVVVGNPARVLRGGASAP